MKRITDGRLWVLITVVVMLLLCGCGGNIFGGGSENASDISGAAADNPKSNYKGDYSWMTMALPWQGEFNVPFFGGSHAKDSEEEIIDLKEGDEFTIYASLGSTEYRVYNVVAVRSDGRVIAAYKDPDSYKYYQKKLALTPEQIKGLLKVLKKNGAGKMLASSVDSEVSDGVQGGFTLMSGGKIRRSYFSNSWPDSFKNIVTYMNDNILKYNPNIKDNGFVSVDKSIISVDPEATMAIRGLLGGK